jgi:hypothetical protein
MKSKTKKYPVIVVNDTMGTTHEAVVIENDAVFLDDAKNAIVIVDNGMHEAKKQSVEGKRIWVIGKCLHQWSL